MTFPIYQNEHAFGLYAWFWLSQNLSDIKITIKYFPNKGLIDTPILEMSSKCIAPLHSKEDEFNLNVVIISNVFH